MEETRYTCIICFNRVSGAAFSDEHLIPQCVGGELVLPYYVCRECNSKLGAEIDHAILEVPDVLDALKHLSIPHDRTKILRHHYKIKGLAGDIELPARATEDGFVFPPRKMPDGSMIYPEDDYKEPLLKRLLRDQRLYDAGLSEEAIRDDYEKLIKAYEEAKPGERIEWPSLGTTLVKRSDRFEIHIEPKQKSDVARLVAKIAYEFAFLMTGREFLLNEDVARPLRTFILTGNVQPRTHIFRLNVKVEEYEPIHAISLIRDDHMTMVTVRFFGSIAYRLIAPPLSENIFDEIANRFNVNDFVGVEYQQWLDKASLGFWALRQEGESKYLGP